ncbi:hypothetical protein, partial [Nocardia cyriacigeorgica]
IMPRNDSGIENESSADPGDGSTDDVGAGEPDAPRAAVPFAPLPNDTGQARETNRVRSDDAATQPIVPAVRADRR